MKLFEFKPKLVSCLKNYSKETFMADLMAGIIVGIVAQMCIRDRAYASTIGKWMLNLANACRLFYADEHPRNRQSSSIWEGDPQHVICYEGLRKDLYHGNHLSLIHI